MELLDSGGAAGASGQEVIDADAGRDMRQLAAIGGPGDRFAWTGASCIPWKGHLLRDDHVVAGNCIKSERVIAAVSQAFADGAGEEFTLRLINAIQAGEDAGGHVDEVEAPDGEMLMREEVFGMAMSAAVAVASPEPEMWHNLRVDAHPNAIAELAVVYRNTRNSAEHLAAFYQGAIRVKPYYWRRIGAPKK